MARIGVFVERYTITTSEEMGALMRLGQVAQRLGHRLDFLFRPEMYKIPQHDALFIRALTDPLNSSYVVARLAEMYGLRVIDDPHSILVCCDKVNMYRHLQRASVPMPRTEFLGEGDLTLERAARLLDELGSPLVLKAPNTSFSMYVEKVALPEDFVRVGRRFRRRADRFVAQEFVSSDFDWRVGVLAGEVLYVCQYVFPKKRWKTVTYIEEGRAVYARVRTFAPEDVPPQLLATARQAAAAVGKGLYGVDLKQTGEAFTVIEVNDNPTINHGDEDRKAPRIYERVVRYLAGEWG